MVVPAIRACDFNFTSKSDAVLGRKAENGKRKARRRTLDLAMIPEVFECPRCERQFVIDGVPDTGSEEVHCPQCSRFLGVRDIAFVLRSELDELIERLSFEKDRLEKDEAIYGLTDCDPEMKYYGREVTRVIGVLRGALNDLHRLREDYRTKD
jgi:DNA-directed RNA polymerase subunit RPC12/RpoP